MYGLHVALNLFQGGKLTRAFWPVTTAARVKTCDEFITSLVVKKINVVQSVTVHH